MSGTLAPLGLLEEVNWVVLDEPRKARKFCEVSGREPLSQLDEDSVARRKSTLMESNCQTKKMTGV